MKKILHSVMLFITLLLLGSVANAYEPEEPEAKKAPETNVLPYTWWTRAPMYAGNVDWAYNPENCLPGEKNPLERAKHAFETWDRLIDGLSRLSMVYVGETDRSIGDHEITVVHCESNEDYAMTRSQWGGGENSSSLAFTVVRAGFNFIKSADIVFRADQPVCVMHEVTHSLGLNHSEDVYSVVSGNIVHVNDDGSVDTIECNEYPSNDDLVGMSALYMQAANCIPYMSEETGRLYLPYVKDVYGDTAGFWAILEEVDKRTFQVIKHGEALNYTYSCDSNYAYGKVPELPEYGRVNTIWGTAFYEGDEIGFTLVEVDGLFVEITELVN